MKRLTKPSKADRKRKFYMALPILVLPFITLLFWALGGGRKAEGQALSAKKGGLDLTLPAVQADGKEYLSKMDYYHEAALDSARRRKQTENDPNYKDRGSLNSAEASEGNDTSSSDYDEISNSSGSYNHYNDPGEAKVYQKLKQLKAVLSETDTMPGLPPGEYTEVQHPDTATVSGADIDRLEQMMQTMNQPEVPDPEMNQLNGMLEKILDIQHPDLVQDKIRKASKAERGQVFAVSASPETLAVSSLDNGRVSYSGQNGFYSLDNPEKVNPFMNAMPAAIYETQTVVNGSTVKLRLLDDISVDGVLVPRNSFLYGEVALNGERLKIKISSIRYQNSIFPVQLSVYDLDGMDGIYIPGAITRDVAKQSGNRAVRSIGMTSLDPSLGAQAASAGIEAARSLLGEKVKLVRVTVKAGYHVLLRDDEQKQGD